jgi:polyferredoxin
MGSEPHSGGLRSGFWPSLAAASVIFLYVIGLGAVQGYAVFPLPSFALLTTALFFGLLLFLSLYTGKLGRWRRVFFIAFAAVFVFWNFHRLLSASGGLSISDEQILTANAPMCHVATANALLPLILRRTHVFPNSLPEAINRMLTVILLTLFFGRSFCSWACWMGGQDEFFSSIGKKPWYSPSRLRPGIRYLPFAVLAIVSFHSVYFLSPGYCAWACPNKIAGDFAELSSTLRVVQFVTFVSIWVLLVFLGSMMLKKRAMCGLLCPMGALLAFGNRTSPFEVRVDRGKCNGCGECISACPNFAWTEENLREGKPWINCARCGRCMDSCPEKAINFQFKWGLFRGLTTPAQAANGWRQTTAAMFNPRNLIVLALFIMAASMTTFFFVQSQNAVLEFIRGRL